VGEQIDWRSARLRSTRDLTPDIRLFEIEPSGEFVIPTPGSHINIVVQIKGRPDVRCYSAVGPCTDGVYRVRRSSAEANFRLLYACRRRQDLAFADELQNCIGHRLQTFIDEEGARIDLDAEIARLCPGGEFYVCGPIGMLEAAKRHWQRSGRPVDQMRFETFGNSGRFASEPFKVKIPRLGVEVDVPLNQTMLEALEAAGIEMIFDCRRGECGLCALTIIETDGIVDHRDVFFSRRREGCELQAVYLRFTRNRRQHHR